jgi:Na+/H+-translocating membrane pyrophosphatase
MARRKTQVKEHELLRRSAILFALVLFMYATSVDAPSALVATARSMVGSAVVGMTAGVEPNPYNSAAGQLAQKQNELESREQLVRAYEGGSLTGTRVLAAASFLVSILVLVLVALNYYMDFRRGRRITA